MNLADSKRMQGSCGRFNTPPPFTIAKLTSRHAGRVRRGHRYGVFDHSGDCSGKRKKLVASFKCAVEAFRHVWSLVDRTPIAPAPVVLDEDVELLLRSHREEAQGVQR
jgi:hypothetical protein